MWKAPPESELKYIHFPSGDQRALSLESTVSRMSGIARQEYYFGRQFSPDEIIEHIDDVTLENIQQVAQTIVDPESLSLTLLGNLKAPGISTETLRDAVA